MKKYTIIIILLLPLLILVLIKSLDTGHFRNDAAKWASPSLSQSNLITFEQLNTLTGKMLIVNMSNNYNISQEWMETVSISAKSLLDKVNQKKLRAFKGSIILFSEDPALSARTWMILSQLGYKNIYILSDPIDNEVLKHKFIPDTSIRQ